MKVSQHGAIRSVITGAIVGSLVAVGVILFGWVAAPVALSMPRVLDVILWLCPLSLSLVGVEGAGLSGFAKTYTFIVLGNAAIYATVFLGITLIWSLIQRLTR
jgi:hypothetical protein